MSLFSRLFRPSIKKLAARKDYQKLAAAMLQDNQKIVNDAYNALLLLGSENAQPIIDALEHESDMISMKAFEILELIGTPAVQPLLDTLADNGSYRSRIAPWLLGNICQKSDDISLCERVVDALIESLKFKDGTLRQNAASALGKLKAVKAIDALVNTLPDSHDMAARNAAWAIAEIAADHAKQCEPAIPGLIKLLRHENADIREQADFTISWIGPAAIDALVEEYKADHDNSFAIVRDRLMEFDAIDLVETTFEPGERIEEAAAPPAWVTIVDTAANTAILTKLCKAYAEKDNSAIAQLEPQATKLGEKLDEAGGLFAMRKMFDKVAHLRGCRTLEMHWGGIGDWRA